MDTKVNYTVVGLFVILLGIAAIGIFFWLSSLRHDKNYQIYLVYLGDEVTGLSEQSPVRYNGVPVGYVSSIQLDDKNPQLVRLMLKIEEGTPITTATVASLSFQGITGSLYVSLKATAIQAEPLKVKPGEPYPVIRSQPSLLFQLSTVLPEIANNIKKLTDDITQLFDEKNRAALHQTIHSVAKFTRMLSDNSETMATMLKQLDITTQHTAKASQDLPQIMRSLNASLIEIQKTAKSVQTASHAMTRAFNEGQGLMQNVSSQVLPSGQQLLMRLNAVAANVQHLTQQLKQQPSVLIKGTQRPPPGPGER